MQLVWCGAGVGERPRPSASGPSGKTTPSSCASSATTRSPFSGIRRVAEHEVAAEPIPAAAYVAALVVYVALGYFLKSIVLNWIVGPLFLVLVLHALPALLRRMRR